LRVLQEKEIRPLGLNKSFKVDVRAVACTNQNLKELMRVGRFREDLYYRLNVVTIELPPLRDRPGDIPLLVEHFLKKYSRELAREGLRLAPGVMDALLGKPWPGNVRELENTIKRAVIMARGSAIIPSDLSTEIMEEESCCGNHRLNHLTYREAKEEVLTRFNVEYLSNVLTDHRGNVTHAAKRCGLERQALQQLLRRYRIKSEDFRSPK
jgi:transcriptional regulator with PAS, ATPase and Fis domain